jgi:hypothetical protein
MEATCMKGSTIQQEQASDLGTVGVSSRVVEEWAPLVYQVG